ncbi:MAG: hypothetical protein GF418_10175 [Chitinivibrionales bacterium]|nr:hypothetical protein [Chitinivibrionales bacterium]MBD3395979.1 hypothetical protein [Chitinivibrionales bacterium]
MIGKVIALPFVIVKNTVGLIFWMIRMLFAVIFGLIRFVFSHIFGTVFGALAGFLLGQKHIGIKFFTGKKKKKKPGE